MSAKIPALSDYTTKAFGVNWCEVRSWRTPKPGARIVTKAELAKVIKEWRADYAKAVKGVIT